MQERKYQRTMGRCLAKMSIAVGPGLSVCCIALRINHDERILFLGDRAGVLSLVNKLYKPAVPQLVLYISRFRMNCYLFELGKTFCGPTELEA